MMRGIKVSPLHGEMEQLDRNATVENFKKHEISVLVATSIAARGLDISGLDLVINFDCPDHLENYVHRVGRTGRSDQTGTAYTFVTPDDRAYASGIVEALESCGQGHKVPKRLRLMKDGTYQTSLTDRSVVR
ncbi:hypothetical protein KIPB_005536 [Kipferlia bialata]|uniref:Helicase C-terminal domain-containing protein n=1 Tax=Kipferlia bialata TaxID=797122 RepID=A0A9K3CXB8_9EUKA|nr:hypothetical protein KIPB_005536 [Kipferlia bialata]|eukprot:g5536.t1